jgi:hypothetical protein
MKEKTSKGDTKGGKRIDEKQQKIDKKQERKKNINQVLPGP